jgi:hypothetical protein
MIKGKEFELRAEREKEEDTGCRIRDSGYEIRDSRCRIQDAGFKMQDSRFRMAICIEYPISCIPNLVS